MYYSDRNAIYYYTISEIIINKVALPNTFFISGIDAASNEGLLRARKITTVFSILDEEDTLPHFDDIAYHRFNIPDGEGDIVAVAQKVAAMLDTMIDQRILIHCAVGMSRSVSVLLYYIMLHSDLTYAKARAMIQRSRRIAAPVELYRNQLMAWHESRSQK